MTARRHVWRRWQWLECSHPRSGVCARCVCLTRTSTERGGARAGPLEAHQQSPASSSCRRSTEGHPHAMSFDYAMWLLEQGGVSKLHWAQRGCHVHLVIFQHTFVSGRTVGGLSVLPAPHPAVARAHHWQPLPRGLPQRQLRASGVAVTCCEVKCGFPALRSQRGVEPFETSRARSPVRHPSPAATPSRSLTHWHFAVVMAEATSGSANQRRCVKNG